MSILRKNWTVAPCPEHGGLHPLHDNRLIVAPDTDGEGGVTIVARMTDLSGQAQLAQLITAAPDLLSALDGLLTAYEACRPGHSIRYRCPCPLEAAAHAALAKARGY